MQTIKIHVTGNSASVAVSGTVTTGQAGQQVEFTFDSAWDGLRKVAVFKVGTRCLVELDIDRTATIPHELLTESNVGQQVLIGVYGTSDDCKVIIPTIWATAAKIVPGVTPSEAESADPTLPIWMEIEERLDALEGSMSDPDSLKGIPELHGTTKEPILLYNLEPGAYILEGYYRPTTKYSSSVTTSGSKYVVLVVGSTPANKCIYIFTPSGNIGLHKILGDTTVPLDIDATSVLHRADITNEYMVKINFIRDDNFVDDYEGETRWGYITEDYSVAQMAEMGRKGIVMVGTFRGTPEGPVEYAAIGTFDDGAYTHSGNLRVTFGVLHHETDDRYHRDRYYDNDPQSNELWVIEGEIQ